MLPVIVCMREAAAVVDAMDELLSTLSVHAHVAFRGIACGRWGIGGPNQGRLAFHLVVRGRCWARVPGQREPVALTAGALLLYRPTTWHLLADSPGTAGLVMPARIEPLTRAEPGPHAGLVCGYFDGAGARSPLIDALPPYLLWRGLEALPGPMAPLVQTLCACAHDDSRAGGRILTRLLEVLLHLVLREPSVARSEAAETLRARCDPGLRRALEALHAEPARRWTLAALARRAGMSRSTFAERFRAATGIPAMTYLRRHRLALAERRMDDGGSSAIEVARAMGFGSVAALRRARRRVALERGGGAHAAGRHENAATAAAPDETRRASD